LPKFRIFLALGSVLASAGLAACTATGNDIAPSFAMTSSADFALPDTVSVVPYAAGGEMPRIMQAGAAAGTSQTAAEAKATSMTKTPETGAVQVAATGTAAIDAAVTPNSYASTEPRAGLDGLIEKYAAFYEVPVELVRRVVKRESNYLPGAYNGGHWGLMQIKHATARGMGYDGSARGLLDAETNLKYAVKYLRGAWLVSGGDHDQAVRLYARGYYYDAKRKGLLDETGLGRDRRRWRG
jgi:soluble lytic murein transglycosylase-like protein